MSVKLKFFSSLVLFSAIFFLVGYLLFSTVLEEFFLPVFYLLLLYFFIITLAGSLVMLKNWQGALSNISIRYLILRWVKVFLHLIFIIIYLLNNRDNAPEFILTFLSVYIIYSVYDVYIMSFYMKKK